MESNDTRNSGSSTDNDDGEGQPVPMGQNQHIINPALLIQDFQQEAVGRSGIVDVVDLKSKPLRHEGNQGQSSGRLHEDVKVDRNGKSVESNEGVSEERNDCTDEEDPRCDLEDARSGDN